MLEATFDIEDVRPWHPKITPYRLGVLLTTIGFGTAKTIEARTGNKMIPTTLEWIGGTVISLVFFCFSSYDGKEHVPTHLRWLFEPDCMNLLWNSLSSLSINPPKYTSTEIQEVVTQDLGNASHLITTYRLLVSSTVLAFGVFKAALSYFGASIAVTWTDWSIAVPLTTIFYVLGLYEYNASNIWPSFYVTDRTDSFYYYMKHSFAIGCYSAWGILSASALVYLWDERNYFFRNPNTMAATTKIKAMTNFVFYYTMIYLVKGTLIMMTTMALGFLATYSPEPARLLEISFVRMGKGVRSSTRFIFRAVGPLLPVSATARLGTFSHARMSDHIDFLTRLCSHVLLHALGLGLCVLYIGMMMGVTLQAYEEMMELPRDFLWITLSSFLSLFILPVDAVVIVGTLFLIYSLFFRFGSL